MIALVALEPPDDVLLGSLVALVDERVGDPFAQHGGALGPVNHAAPEAPAVGHVPGLGEHPRPVGERVLDGVVVEHLVRLGASLPPALSLGRHRPGVLDPAAHVEIVNQPVQDEAAAQPVEVVEVADLVGHFAHVRPASA